MSKEFVVRENVVSVGGFTKFLVLLFTFAVNLDNVVLIPIIATYAASLGADIAMVGFIVGIYSIIHIPSNVISGRIADKIGRKTTLLIGLTLDATAMILYALSSNPVMLLFVRAIHGFGGGFGGPSSMTYLGDVTPKSRSGRSMALYGISFGLAYIVGFSYSGIITYFFGYKFLFMTVAVFLYLMALLSITLPRIHRPHLEKEPSVSIHELYKKVLVKKPILVSYVAIFAAYFNLGIITTVYTLILEGLGYDHRFIGMVLTLMIIVSISIQYPMGLLGDKFGKQKLIILGLLFNSLSFIVFSLRIETMFIIVGMMILGVGHGMLFPTASGLVRDETVKDVRGLATGVYYGVLILGIAVGAPVIGVLAGFVGLSESLWVGVILPIIAMSLVTILQKL